MDIKVLALLLGIGIFITSEKYSLSQMKALVKKQPMIYLAPLLLLLLIALFGSNVEGLVTKASPTVCKANSVFTTYCPKLAECVWGWWHNFLSSDFDKDCCGGSGSGSGSGWADKDNYVCKVGGTTGTTGTTGTKTCLGYECKPGSTVKGETTKCKKDTCTDVDCCVDDILYTARPDTSSYKTAQTNSIDGKGKVATNGVEVTVSDGQFTDDMVNGRITVGAKTVDILAVTNATTLTTSEAFPVASAQGYKIQKPASPNCYKCSNDYCVGSSRGAHTSNICTKIAKGGKQCLCSRPLQNHTNNLVPTKGVDSMNPLVVASEQDFMESYYS